MVPTNPAEGGSPLYAQIAAALRRELLEDEAGPGAKLPAERELARRFGVARSTVSHALRILQHEGIIEKRRGRHGGSYVRGLPPLVDATTLEGFLPQLHQRGHVVSSKVLVKELRLATEAVAAGLRCEPDSPVFFIARLRCVDGKPLLLERSYFPAELVPGMLDSDLTGSLYRLLAARWGLAPARKQEVIEPARATEQEKELFRTGKHLPLLRLVRETDTAEGRRIEYSEDLLRADLARLRVVTDSRDP